MKILSFIFLTFLVSAPGFVFADGDDNNAAPTEAPRAVGTPGSDASFDKRLPPVLPGERINDNGKEVRVWSSAGPVTVSPPPEPFQRQTDEHVSDLIGGVIVDRRDDSSRR